MNIELHGCDASKTGRKASSADFGRLCAEKMAAAVRRYFREKHESKVRENVAAAYGVSDRQAGAWLRRGVPSKHLAVMIAREGMAFVNKVIHPLASREANADNITIKEVLAKRRAQREEQRILAGCAAALAGAPLSRSGRAIRAAGAAVRLIAKLVGRRRQNVGAL